MLDNHFLTEDAVALWTSSDGSTWNSVVTTIPYAQPTSVAYGNGQFVMVGYGGLVATSTNGSTWTQQPFANSNDNGLTSVTFGGGKFVAVSALGSAYESTNGSSWTQSTASAGALDGVCYGNGEFVAVAGIYGSSDGINWTRESLSVANASQAFAACGFGDNHLVAVGNSADFAISP